MKNGLITISLLVAFSSTTALARFTDSAPAGESQNVGWAWTQVKQVVITKVNSWFHNDTAKKEEPQAVAETKPENKSVSEKSGGGITVTGPASVQPKTDSCNPFKSFFA